MKLIKTFEMLSALFSFSWVELNNADLDIADQNSEVRGVRGVRGVRVIHLAIENSSFPDELKCADVTCLPKNGPSNRPFSYSAKEPESSVIFIHFYTRDSIEWR